MPLFPGYDHASPNDLRPPPFSFGRYGGMGIILALAIGASNHPVSVLIAGPDVRRPDFIEVGFLSIFVICFLAMVTVLIIFLTS